MSQNASLRGSKGSTKVSSLSTKTQNQVAETTTNHNNNNITALKSKNKQQNSDENHNNTKQEQKESGNQSQTIKPTAEQLRLAQLIGPNKSDDPEINKKIKQVQELVPSRLQDEILMALHENDYDIAKTIEFFLEGGGDLSQDWKTAGIRTKKPNTSPNQTLDEGAAATDELVLVQTNNSQPNSNRNNKSNNKQQNESNNNNNVRSRERNRNNSVKAALSVKYNKNKNETNNGPPVVRTDADEMSNLDDRFVNSMDLNKDDGLTDYNGANNDQQYYNNQRNSNNRRGNYSLSARGVNGGTNNYRGGGRSGGGGGGTGRGRSTGYNRGSNNNVARNQRKDDQVIDSTCEISVSLDEKANSPVLIDPITEFDPNLENAILKSKEPVDLNDPNVGKDANDLLNKKYATTGRNSKEDNLRDIGTWSNEQADKNSSNRSSSSHNKPTHFNTNSTNNRQNNRFNNKNQPGGVNNPKQNDDWENEEEWQGDLTQTQIFTASTQKKDNNENNVEAFTQQRGNALGSGSALIDSDFPIGHFNAEEAAQKIKNAVGIGSTSSPSTGSVNKKNTNQNSVPSSTATVNNIISDDLQSKDAVKQTVSNKQHQQQQQNYRSNKFGSVKPPPPSTRIPKSAVVMPDGSSSNGFSLDVQFGVDLDTPLSDNKETNDTTSANPPKIINEPIGKKLNMVSPQVLHNMQQPKPIQQTVNKSVSSSTVSSTTTPSVSSTSSLGTFPPTSNNIEKVANVGVVNPVINSSNNVQANSGAKLLNTENSIVGVGTNSNKLDNNLTHSINNAASSVTAPLQQQNILPHGMDNIKKLNHDNFIDVNKQKQANHQQQNYQFQQQINHLNIQKQQHQQMPQKHQPYMNQNDTSILNQQQNMIQRDTNNHHHQQNNNLNSHHYQQSQQHHHHQQLNVNSNLNMTNSQMKDSNSNQNLSAVSSSSTTGSNTQLLNISPQNISSNKNNNPNQPSNVQLGQQQQLMNHQNSNNNNSNALSQTQGLNSSQNSINNVANTAAVAAAASVNSKQSAMPPPPGVNIVNPNSQFLMSLPFVCYDQQNFPYFDASQIDGNSIMQMYNHLGLGVPPGVGSTAPAAAGAGGATPGGPPYSIADSKFNRSEATSSNTQLNVNAAAAAAAQLSQQQQQQQQQQQPINLIPGLSNFPFFFHNYYPNMFMSVPNGPQANPQFQNKPPYNFNNNAPYDDQNKDYSNYNPQAQIKTPGSNLNNVPDINSVGYQKNVDKTNTGYHTPPPNYSNSLMNQQQQHPNVSGTSGAPPLPAQYAYITSMVGTPGGNPLVHTGLQQENINTRAIGNSGANNIKPLQKNNYQNSPWN